MKRLAGVHCVPAAGVGGQSGQQGAAGEEDLHGPTLREGVGWIGDRKPVQDGGSDVCRNTGRKGRMKNMENKFKL